MSYPCTGKQDLFFSESRSRHEAAAAKKLCSLCPIRQECLEMALINNEIHGIWGGTSPNDRRKLRKGYPTSPLFYPSKREAPLDKKTDPAFMNTLEFA